MKGLTDYKENCFINDPFYLLSAIYSSYISLN